jgi:hypothetical protein
MHKFTEHGVLAHNVGAGMGHGREAAGVAGWMDILYAVLRGCWWTYLEALPQHCAVQVRCARGLGSVLQEIGQKSKWQGPCFFSWPPPHSPTRYILEVATYKRLGRCRGQAEECG